VWSEGGENEEAFQIYLPDRRASLYLDGRNSNSPHILQASCLARHFVPQQGVHSRIDRPKISLFYHVVRFNLIENGQTIIRNAYAHSGDWMDISFELAYPEHAWVSENVIRFWRNPDGREDKSDTLLVSNDTDKAIKYLKIYAKDMFLVFDMQPKSSLRLSFSHQPEGSWIDCEGAFEDGQRIEDNGVGFSRNDKLDEPMHYCMSIDYSRVKIESPQAEGYYSDSDWKKPNVPKATNCNP
jgi:hypothetical protein